MKILSTNHCSNSTQSSSKRILEKYKDRVPIIVLADIKDFILEKNKFLVPKDLSFGQFCYIVRKRVKLSENDGLYFFINNKLIANNQCVEVIYKNNKNDDGFLYITLKKEETFG